MTSDSSSSTASPAKRSIIVSSLPSAMRIRCPSLSARSTIDRALSRVARAPPRASPDRERPSARVAYARVVSRSSGDFRREPRCGKQSWEEDRPAGSDRRREARNADRKCRRACRIRSHHAFSLNRHFHCRAFAVSAESKWRRAPGDGVSSGPPRRLLRRCPCISD